MKVGAFEDPNTSSPAADAVTAIRLVEKVIFILHKNGYLFVLDNDLQER